MYLWLWRRWCTIVGLVSLQVQYQLFVSKLCAMFWTLSIPVSMWLPAAAHAHTDYAFIYLMLPFFRTHISIKFYIEHGFGTHRCPKQRQRYFQNTRTRRVWVSVATEEFYACVCACLCTHVTNSMAKCCAHCSRTIIARFPKNSVYMGQRRKKTEINRKQQQQQF